MGLAATLMLCATVALILVPGGVFFAILTFALFIFALIGVLAGLEDRTVGDHRPDMSATKWREGSSRRQP
jgi:hypothetical protein